MEIIQIVAIGLVATILTLTLKKQVPQFSLIISIAASVLIFFMVLPKLVLVIELLTKLVNEVETNMSYIFTVIKIVGIAYIAEFGSQLCLDAGESAIASKIEIGGKILIMVMSAPILLSLVELIINILPQ